MPWDVEYTDEFEAWWLELDEPAQDAVDRSVLLLQARGPALGFPHSPDVHGSRHGNMRELRVQHRGDPIRILHAFDPGRTALFLIGGNKAGDDRFYERVVPLADRIDDEHLQQLTEGSDPHGQEV